MNHEWLDDTPNLTVTKHVRSCTACGRPGYHTHEAIAPCYAPTCGTCIAWAWLIKRIWETYETLDPASTMWPVVRVLVLGALREGTAHRLMMGVLAQFVAEFCAVQKAKL